jgi:hypothetical protein
MESAQTPGTGESTTGFEARPFVAAPESHATDSTPGGSPAAADAAGHDAFADRPELYVGAAFAGGLAVAGLLRLLGR